MLHGYKKKRYQLFDNLDYLGFNLYEQRHFCFGDEGDGPGGEGGSPDDADSRDSGIGPANVGPAQDFSGYGGPDFDGGRAGGPVGSSIGTGVETSQMMMDPVFNPEEFPEYAKEFAQTYLEMMVEIVEKFGPEDPTGKYALNEIAMGRLANEVQSPELMNRIRDLGLPSYGSGYRGQYEARTGPTNAMLSVEQYDPSTITGADPESQSGINLSMFNQFAIDNPNMTVEQAMEAYNNEMGPNSINQVSAIELGMLGYAPNAPAGRAAQDNENERERGLYQGLGLLASFAVSPTSLIGNIMSPGLTDPSRTGSLANEIASALGWVGPSPSMLDEAFGMTTALGLQDLYDSLPDMPSFDMPSFSLASRGFGGLLGDPEEETETAAFTGFETPQSFFDTVATDMTTEEMADAIDAIMEEDPEFYDQPLRARTPFQTASSEEDDSGFIPFRERFPELNRSAAWKKRYQELAALYGPKKAKEMMKQEERFV